MRYPTTGIKNICVDSNGVPSKIRSLGDKPATKY